MKIFHTENGQISITGDEDLLTKIEGENLEEVNIDGIRATADELAKLYEVAGAKKTVEAIGKYKLLKQKYIAAFSK
ncbi:hypothetical protein M3221_00360 [Domibacillus indicus]|uniref:hypothetical protein n=1 Tax=Domibacillus indicus TaxID=1437523 RepID=UPI00203D126E|nr:hypothetical protein [Domibacillus indicus]MCM3786882.1 hypothetical protein [Domibacillus indicus]